MLYEEKLKLYNSEVKIAVDKLFDEANKNQSHENDLFLVVIHGFYDEDVLNWRKDTQFGRFNPYVFGQGEEGIIHSDQDEFYKGFLNSRVIHGDPNKYREHLKTKKDWYTEQSITTQMELVVYLKLWESDYILKNLYNLCRLARGESYDWHKKLGNSRKKIIENDIKNSIRNVVPEFHDLIDATYNRQIRNAAAHSQYRIAGDYLNLYNDNPNAGSPLKNITIEEWEVIFHKTLLLYLNLVRNLNECEKRYRKLAEDRHFGLQIRISKDDGAVQYEWIRLREPHYSDYSPWIWYRTYSQHYIPRFHIVVN